MRDGGSTGLDGLGGVRIIVKFLSPCKMLKPSNYHQTTLCWQLHSPLEVGDVLVSDVASKGYLRTRDKWNTSKAHRYTNTTHYSSGCIVAVRLCSLTLVFIPRTCNCL